MREFDEQENKKSGPIKLSEILNPLNDLQLSGSTMLHVIS